MEKTYNASNPYNFVIAVHEADSVVSVSYSVMGNVKMALAARRVISLRGLMGAAITLTYLGTKMIKFPYLALKDEEGFADEILTLPYDPYLDPSWYFYGLVFRYLKNVRFDFATRRQIMHRLRYVVGVKAPSEARINYWARIDYVLKGRATVYGVIDSMVAFYGVDPRDLFYLHVSPMVFSHSWVIVSAVRSDAREESSETLWFQGLSSLVWVLVAVSLLVVTGLATYSLRSENEKKRRRWSQPLTSWMNSVFIYAVDVVNNCVAGVVRPGPVRYLRSWWLLGVVFLMQFWSAGMMSNLLLDTASFINSLENLLSKPELECLISRHGEDPFLIKPDDPRYEGYRKMKKRFVNDIRDTNSIEMFTNGSAVAMIQEKNVPLPDERLFEKLRENKRKQYVGETRYRQKYTYTLYNKRIPRAIKENIDYLTSRLTETRQAEMRNKRDEFRSRDYMFDSKDDSAATVSWSAKSLHFFSPAFRLWMIGWALSICVFCVEFYRSRVSIARRPLKVSPQSHSIGI